MRHFIALLKNDAGATSIEYAIIALLISTAAIAAMNQIGANLSNPFNTVSANLPAR